MEKGKRGFASMSPEKRAEIARMGGKAAHEKGTAHKFSPEEAKAAGHKGGSTPANGRHRFTVDEAREAGRKGGKAQTGKPRRRTRHITEGDILTKKD